MWENLVPHVATFVIAVLLTFLGLRSKYQAFLSKLRSLTVILTKGGELFQRLAHLMDVLEQALKDEKVTEEEYEMLFKECKSTFEAFKKVQEAIQDLLRDD